MKDGAWWASLAGAGEMKEMPLEAESEGGDAPVSLLVLPPTAPNPAGASDMVPAGVSREV